MNFSGLRSAAHTLLLSFGLVAVWLAATFLPDWFQALSPLGRLASVVLGGAAVLVAANYVARRYESVGGRAIQAGLQRLASALGAKAATSAPTAASGQPQLTAIQSELNALTTSTQSLLAEQAQLAESVRTLSARHESSMEAVRQALERLAPPPGANRPGGASPTAQTVQTQAVPEETETLPDLTEEVEIQRQFHERQAAASLADIPLSPPTLDTSEMHFQIWGSAGEVGRNVRVPIQRPPPKATVELSAIAIRVGLLTMQGGLQTAKGLLVERLSQTLPDAVRRKLTEAALLNLESYGALIGSGVNVRSVIENFARYLELIEGLARSGPATAGQPAEGEGPGLEVR